MPPLNILLVIRKKIKFKSRCFPNISVSGDHFLIIIWIMEAIYALIFL